jgi:hypothetical protein
MGDIFLNGFGGLYILGAAITLLALYAGVATAIPGGVLFALVVGLLVVGTAMLTCACRDW